MCIHCAGRNEAMAAAYDRERGDAEDDGDGAEGAEGRVAGDD